MVQSNYFDPNTVYCDDCGIEIPNHSLWEFSEHNLCFSCFKDRNNMED
jgi:NMD protein affecting ribosome stability and mRNA decay